MAESSSNVQALRLAVEVRYFGFPRDRWELLLVRARQLGANTVIAPVLWAWHELQPGTFDFTGATDARRDLVGFVELCELLGLQVVLRLHTHTSRALPDDHVRDKARCTALTTSLLALEYPRGAIVELQLAEPKNGRILSAAGWHAPIRSIAPPAPTANAIDARFDQLTHTLVLAADASPFLERVATSDPTALHTNGALRANFWRTKLLWMLLGAVGDDFVATQQPVFALPDELELQMAWADTSDVDVAPRYSREHIYLLIENQRAASYSGLLTYRALNGEVLHVHVGLGNLRSGLALMREDEVVGVAFDGDGSEGGWLARGLRTSVVFSNGAGCVAPCGNGLLLSAPQSGRFQLRRSEGWRDMAAYRLLLNGALLPAEVIANETHLLLPYVADDADGSTDLYLLMPTQETLPAKLQHYLGTLQNAQAAVLRRAEAIASELRVQVASRLAGVFAELDVKPATCDAYVAAWRAAADAREKLLNEVHSLRRAKWDDYASGAVAHAIHADFEAKTQQILELAGLFA